MSSDCKGGRVSWCAGVLAMLALAAGVQAQQPSGQQSGQPGGQTPQGGVVMVAPPATGSVTGQVIAQDTQLPARFAQVTLQSVGAASGGGGGGGFGGFGGGFGGSVQARTGVDGTFEAGNVAPGDYYVMAWAPGYVPERSLLTAQVMAGADANDLLGQIPVVHVGADSISSVTVTMVRGGTIAGRLVWEDGSPATGVSVLAPLSGAAVTLPAALQQIRSTGAGGFGTTDDKGGFRLSGLATGDYLLQAVIQDRPQFGGFARPARQGSAIRVYAPGVFRKADAKPISIRAGEERGDVRVVIDLRGLHTVSGHATSVTAGQSVETGRVMLVDPSDNSLSLTGAIDAKGEFTVQYVPPGNYTLEIAGASTEANGMYRGRGGFQSSGVSFQPFSQPVVVGDTDVTGVAAALTPVQSSSQ
jgi:hypothetical protein